MTEAGHATTYSVCITVTIRPTPAEQPSIDSTTVNAELPDTVLTGILLRTLSTLVPTIRFVAINTALNKQRTCMRGGNRKSMQGSN